MSDEQVTNNPLVPKTTEQIIRQHVIFSLLAGAIPLPIVDIAAVTAIQIDMLKQIAATYDVDFNQERGKSIAAALVGTTLGRIGASAIKAIPGVGTAIGIGSQVIISGATTYALGQVFDYHFKNNGSLFDFDLEKMKDKFQEFFEKGKEIAKNLNKKPAKDDVFETIKKLQGLKDSGAISEKEFQKTKDQLLSKLSE